MFSLEPVLKVRTYREKAQQQEYALYLRNKQDIEERITEIRDRLSTELEKSENAEVTKIHQFRNKCGQVEHMHQLMDRLMHDLKKAEDVLESERNKLIEAHRNMHIMESMKSREKTNFIKHVDYLEQMQSDEVSIQMTSRKMK